MTTLRGQLIRYRRAEQARKDLERETDEWE